jgi:hypothetical protein
LAEGTHTLSVRVYDGLTYSSVTSRTFYVDKTSPSLSLSNAGGDLTNITVQDSLAGLASLRYAWEQTGSDYAGTGVADVSASTCSGGNDGSGLFSGLSGSKSLLTSSDMMPPDECYWVLYVCAVDSVGNIGYVSEGFYYELWLDLGVGNVAFDTSPVSNGDSQYTLATAETNSSTGYDLSIVTDNSELVCEGNATIVMPSVASAGALTISAGAHGAWGWSVVKPAGLGGSWTGSPPDLKPELPENPTWQPAPVGAGATIGNYAQRPPTEGHSYGLFFGAKVDMGQATCVYGQTLTVSLVANI